MAVQFATTTDTEEQLRQTAEYFNLEAYDAEQDEGGDTTPEPAAAEGAATEVTPAPESTTAAAQAPVEETQENTEEPPRDEKGRFKSVKLQARFDELTFKQKEAERK